MKEQTYIYINYEQRRQLICPYKPSTQLKLVIVVYLPSHVWFLATLDYITPGFPVLHYLLKFTQIHVHWVGDALSNYLTLCRLFLLLPSIFLIIKIFSNKSSLCIRGPKFWSFSFSISPSSEYSGLISFRIDWFDFAVQGTLKSLPQHHSSKVSILWSLAFFMVQLSTSIHDYWKNHSFDQTDLCQQSNVSALLAKWCFCFLIHYLGFS